MAKEELTRTKIIMLGGRRSGKSTILATLINAFNENASHLCTFTDNTPYGASSGMDVTLTDKRREIYNYMMKRSKYGSNSQFVVDMSQNVGQGDYNIVASVSGASQIGFDFVDVPGEWMWEQHEFHGTLKTHVEQSDVFVIAIDTPYLMQNENDCVNTVWNRIDEITNLINNLKIEDEADRKLIIFVPVKCEKWVNEGRIEEVTNRVKLAYRLLINHWVENKSVNLWIMPIVTAGAIEHTQLLDGYRFFRTKEDKVGDICSMDPYTQILRLRDGKTLSDTEVESVDTKPCKDFEINYTQIPLSWYKICGQGKYKPALCEQVAFHILKFLVEKEEELSSEKYKTYRNKPWWIRIFSSGGRFGKYLNIYKDLIGKIPIKQNGDGFTKITEPIKASE